MDPMTNTPTILPKMRVLRSRFLPKRSNILVEYHRR